MSNNAVFFKKIDKIPAKIWDELDCSDNLYFSPEYLSAIEKNNPQLLFSYIVIKNDQQKAIAFASIQIISFYINTIEKELPTILKKVTSVARKLTVLPKEKPLKILNCGNSFVSGEHGIYIKKDQNKKILLKKISKEILRYTQENHLLDSIDLFIVKDFFEQSLSISDELTSSGYYSFNVEPNMTLKMDSSWHTFEDYLGVLKTKFRVKAKKALKLSNSLLVREITAHNFDEQVHQMITLYRRVVSKATFNLGEFKLATFKDLKEKLGESYILKSYWIDNKMVGFMSGLINKNHLDAHFVGIDYALNKKNAIYQRMLYDYIDIAISHNVTTLNFGRTASEIKSSVGATPEQLTIYIRHKKSITNKFLKLFLLKIQPTEYKQKFPFKIDI